NEWSQTVLDAALPTPPNVTFEVERSLDITHGPIYAVTVFDLDDDGQRQQFLQFTVHHLVVDWVSWRILLDDLQTLMETDKKNLPSKTTSFKAWSEALTLQAPKWDATAWSAFMGDDVPAPIKTATSMLKHCAYVAPAVTDRLDAANAVYGTTIQDLALAALTGAWGELFQPDDDLGQDVGHHRQLHLMMEGHGRDTSWNPLLDVSSTVGWFTCEYPVVFDTHASSTGLADLVRHVKQTLRSVPDYGLSYSALKYLVPFDEASPSATSSLSAIKTHRRHNLYFSYAGRFQEMAGDASLFEPVTALDIPQLEEVDVVSGDLLLDHQDHALVLRMTVPSWLLNQDQVELWGSLWSKWMGWLVEHCLDPATIGGRTLSDVPLLQSTSIVRDVEAEVLSTLHLRPVDIVDMYPVTPLQSGLLSALVRDPAEYILQYVFDIAGDFTFAQLEACGRKLVQATPVL
ncbi:hypothetical protein As57867_003884, partial [Aphanomyces stellatus]